MSIIIGSYYVYKARYPIPVEIKASKTVATNFFKELIYWNNTSNSLDAPRYVIYGGTDNQSWPQADVIATLSLTDRLCCPYNMVHKYYTSHIRVNAMKKTVLGANLILWISLTYAMDSTTITLGKITNQTSKPITWLATGEQISAMATINPNVTLFTITPEQQLPLETYIRIDEEPQNQYVEGWPMHELKATITKAFILELSTYNKNQTHPLEKNKKYILNLTLKDCSEIIHGITCSSNGIRTEVIAQENR